eukprot:TRINITY_DN30742_c0_g1_i1.p1 TRINITY_DN30742_c0_g1~~TRINITY_DN30742_c0_g1_i1.p1  ORF type:complete len:426 (+),score=111.55 TRINITY_DN30742_c0_g1_i1:48-1325(+)
MAAAGVAHSLSLLEDGSVIGWGASDHKQTVLQSPSLPLFNGRRAVTISAGYFHSLALLNDGSVVGWGYDNDDQCTPPRGIVPTDAYVTDISAGGRHSMALLNTGEVIAWGCNEQKQITVPKFDPERRVVAISAGCYHSLALLDDGTVKGWGGNQRMGPGRPPQFGNRKTVAMTAGRAHSLALLADGGVVGWGDNTHGQALPPSFRSMGKTVVKLAAGGQHSLALLRDGSIVCWGGNSAHHTPLQGGLKAVAIDAGGHHSAALLADGSTISWGGNSSAQSYAPSFRYRKAVPNHGREVHGVRVFLHLQLLFAEKHAQPESSHEDDEGSSVQASPVDVPREDTADTTAEGDEDQSDAERATEEGDSPSPEQRRIPPGILVLNDDDRRTVCEYLSLSMPVRRRRKPRISTMKEKAVSAIDKFAMKLFG